MGKSMDRRNFIALASTTAATLALTGCATSSESDSTAVSANQPQVYDGYFKSHEPLGAGKGIFPGRVSWAYKPGCTSWAGTGYWWELGNFDEVAIQAAVDAALPSGA